MINRAEKEWNEPRLGYSAGASREARAMTGLDVRVEKAEGGGMRFTLVLPYPSIWMKARGDAFETTLEVAMTVRDAQGAEAWTFSKSFPLEVPVSRLKETAKSAFTADAEASLGPGSYTLAVTVTNTHDGSKASLERAFTI
jgi:hypothetical protein